jgi:hypothetical protein
MVPSTDLTTATLNDQLSGHDASFAATAIGVTDADEPSASGWPTKSDA